MESFDFISSESEEGLLDEIVVGFGGADLHNKQLHRLKLYQQQRYQLQHQHSQPHQQQQQQHLHQQHSHYPHHHAHNKFGYYHSQPYLCHKSQYDPMESPIHYCDNTTQLEDATSSMGDMVLIMSQSSSGSIGFSTTALACEATDGSECINYCDEDVEVAAEENKENQEPQHGQQRQTPSQRRHHTQPIIRCSSTSTESDDLNIKLAHSQQGNTNRGSICSSESSTTACTIISHEEADQLSIVTQVELADYAESKENLNLVSLNLPDGSSHSSSSASSSSSANAAAAASSSNASAAAASFNHQLTADMCNFKNSKSRRLEYSLKCLKYGRSNPSQDSAFGSLTDNDLSTSSFRLSSFQSISSPIDEGVEEVIIATTTAGHETCLELATIPRNMVSQDSAISSPCRESSPSNFLNIEEGSCSGASSSSGSTGNLRPQHFPVSLSPKILVTATTNSSNSSLNSNSGTQSAAYNQHMQSQQQQQQQQQQQFDPPKILVNDQNSIYTTSPSKRSGTIEVFSQKYRVSSFEDMSPLKRGQMSDKQHLKNVNRLAFRSLEEERRIDNAFMPIADRVHSDNRVNVQSEKYKKLTHASFRISKTSSQVIMYDTSPGQMITSSPGSSTMLAQCGTSMELQRPATASGSSSSRQTMWRDSKFYRKNRIAKSNDSLLETSPNHSARLSPSSLRDNHYDSSSSYGGSRSHSRQSLNRGGSIHEIMGGSNQTLGPEITVTTSFCNNAAANSRRYCSSKSEDLGDSSDYLRVMDARKSYSERHLVTFETTLKQTAINNTMPLDGSDPCYQSEEDTSFNDDNNAAAATATYQNVPLSQTNNQHRSSSRNQQQQQQQHHTQQQVGCSNNYHKYGQKAASTAGGKLNSFTDSKQRSYPNQLSWSSNSISNRLKTTSLATLSCQQNLNSSTNQPTAYNIMANQSLNSSGGSSASSSASSTMKHSSQTDNYLSHSRSTSPSTSGSALIDTTNRSPKKSARNPVFKALGGKSPDTTLNDTSSDNSSSRNGSVGRENSSSPDDSPSRRIISGIELAKIFSMEAGCKRSGSCSEEKTPLLDSVEMSPISPTDPDDDDNDALSRVERDLDQQKSKSKVRRD